MQVERMPLPGAATVVVFGVQRRALVDSTLSRDEACLALTGVLPHVHPDVVDHWLDTAFERRKLPFTARQYSALFGAALALLAVVNIQPGHDHVRGRRTPALSLVVAGIPDLIPV